MYKRQVQRGTQGVGEQPLHGADGTLGVVQVQRGCVVPVSYTHLVLEAVLKVAIFLTYMAAISRMKEIHRVFEYHGAEHKTIACYEACLLYTSSKFHS